MTKFFAAAALVASMAFPMAASAATLIEDGMSYEIEANDQFFGNVNAGALGGAGSFEVEFFTTADPLPGNASTTIGNVVSGQFTDLLLSWIAADGITVLASVAVEPPVVSLDTVFTAPNLTQTMVLSWTDSSANVGFDVEVVAAVPLPAAGGLLLTMMVAGGIAARRKKKAA